MVFFETPWITAFNFQWRLKAAPERASWDGWVDEPPSPQACTGVQVRLSRYPAEGQGREGGGKTMGRPKVAAVLQSKTFW